MVEIAVLTGQRKGHFNAPLLKFGGLAVFSPDSRFRRSNRGLAVNILIRGGR
jgi:hypothetical protein